MPTNEAGIFSNKFVYKLIVQAIIQPMMLFGVFSFYRNISNLQATDETNLKKLFGEGNKLLDPYEEDIKKISIIEETPFLLSSVKKYLKNKKIKKISYMILLNLYFYFLII
jgi:hypothetical protein